MTEPGKTPQKASRTFSKNQRVRKRLDFQRIFESGKITRGSWFSVRSLREEGFGPARLGLVISGKVEPTAVKRNLWKRRVREVFRHEAHRIKKGYLILVQARTNSRVPKKQEIEKEFEDHLLRQELFAARETLRNQE